MVTSGSARRDAQSGRIIPPEAVADVGHGSPIAGHKVLAKFVSNIRHQGDRGHYARGGPAKLTKEQANYRNAIEDGQFCALCSMFTEPTDCTLVQGQINRTSLCDYFEKA
jgi:hypothetical protein